MQLLAISHADAHWHEAFIRYVPEVFPRVNFRRWYELGGWDERYRAFAIANDGAIVANASLQQMRIVLDGRELTGWQLGAVGVLPEWRGQGLQRRIMPRLLEAAAAEDIVFLFANEDVLDFYPRFGFRRVIESVFGAGYTVAPSATRLRRLSLDRADDRMLLARLAAQSRPVTDLFGARDYGGVLLWYWANFYQDCVHYCAEDDAIVIAEQEGDMLCVCDILTRGPIDLPSYLPRIATSPARRVEFGFTPGQWWPDAKPLAEYTESPLFVRGALGLPNTPFKFPMLAQT